MEQKLTDDRTEESLQDGQNIPVCQLVVRDVFDCFWVGGELSKLLQHHVGRDGKRHDIDLT